MGVAHSSASLELFGLASRRWDRPAGANWSTRLREPSWIGATHRYNPFRGLPDGDRVGSERGIRKPYEIGWLKRST
jgi:hypothetical protein